MKLFFDGWDIPQPHGVSPGPGSVLAGLLLGLAATAPLPVHAQVQCNWVAFYHNSVETTNRPVAVALDKQGNVCVGGFSQGANMPGSVYTALKYSPQGEELWVARHLEPEGYDDKPSCMALDDWGNLYLTGCSKSSGSGGDFLTVKFDANGTEQWACRYNGPGNDDDRAKALALDAQGNVYVAGRVYIGTTNWPTGTVRDYAYATIKYDANGNQLWERRYANGHTEANPSGSSNQDAQALVVDSAGNVYVAGVSVFAPDPRAPGAGFAVVKYGPDGEQLGVWRYDSFGNTDGSQGRVSLALGPAGEIYVAGTMLPVLSPPPCYTLLKFGTNGTREWVRSYYGTNPYGPGSNCVQSLAVDAGANVFLTGTSPGPSNTIDCATLKYDGQGNQLWVDRYNPTTNGIAFANDLKLDVCGNVSIAGSCRYLDSTWKYLVVKYSPTGQRLWGAFYGTGGAGESVARAIAVTEQGRTTVTGYVTVSPGSGQVFATVDYSVPGGAIALLDNGNAKVFFPGLPGSAWRIQTSINLVDWADLGVVVADNDGACILEDLTSSRFPVRFYRSVSP